ncbi:opsin-5-like [Lethenteron reissneri]|uniref:opsin-5-like n=1 Tax=Lethenteron reissneri TaxID=7753 RepID=UPI002AB7C25E|nr:opsin-5-like [Lethenteron reissneri]
MAEQGEDDQFRSKLSPTADIAAGTFLLAVTVLSLLGNGAVLGVAARRWARLNGPELLSVNLALTDLGIAASIYPLAVASAWSHRWLGGQSVCTYYAFAGFFFGTASMGTLTAMAAVRYKGTSTQVHVKKMTKRAMVVVIVAVWAYAMLWSCLPLLGWGSYGVEPFGVSCTLAWAELQLTPGGAAFLYAMFVLCLLLPAIAIGLCYAGIVCKLRRAYHQVRSKRRTPTARHVESRLTKMAVLVTVGFIGCWSPYAIVSLWSLFRSPGSISPLVALLPCLFAKSSTVYNPFIYYLFSRSFRAELRSMACPCLDARRPGASSESAPPLPPQRAARRSSQRVWSITEARPAGRSHPPGDGGVGLRRSSAAAAARDAADEAVEGTTDDDPRPSKDVAAMIPLVSFDGGGGSYAPSSEGLLLPPPPSPVGGTHRVLLETAPAGRKPEKRGT